MSRSWLICLFLWMGCLFLLSPWDLTISRILVTPESWFGRLINDWGGAPGWLFIILSLASLWSKKPLVPKCVARSALLLGLVQGVLVTHVLKQFWGRPRPSDLSSIPVEYSPFYLPTGPGGGESFPSGHVAAAMLLAPIPFYLWARGRKGPAAFVFAVLLLYWFSVCYGRVLFGVHFPTDCLFSLGFGLLFSGATSGMFFAQPKD